MKRAIRYIKKLFTVASPSKVIEAVLGRDLAWYDYEKLETDKQKIYYQKIQQVLSNDAFQNEVKHLLTDLVEEVATSELEIHRDKHLRWSINGVEALMERLNEISDPSGVKPKNNYPNDDI